MIQLEKNHLLIIAMIIVYDQQQPNITTIRIINIQQPLPTSELAPIHQKISKQFRRQTHTGYLLSMTSGFVYKKSTVFVCGSIIIFLINLQSCFFVEECTEDEDANEGKEKEENREEKEET